MNESAVRCFLAAPLPDHLAEPLNDAVDVLRLQGQTRRVRWVPERNWHLTLAFLGDQSPAWIGQLHQALQASSLLPPGSDAIALQSRWISGFPDAKSRIVALEFHPQPALVALKAQLDLRLQTLGWTPDPRRFRPHVTLGRVQRDHTVHIRPLLCELVWPVAQITLYQSTLGPGGSEYQALWSVPVQSALDHVSC